MAAEVDGTHICSRLEARKTDKESKINVKLSKPLVSIHRSSKIFLVIQLCKLNCNMHCNVSS